MVKYTTDVYIVVERRTQCTELRFVCTWRSGYASSTTLAHLPVYARVSTGVVCRGTASKYICMYVCACAPMYRILYAHTRTHTHIYVYTHTGTHTHTTEHVKKMRVL